MYTKNNNLTYDELKEICERLQTQVSQFIVVKQSLITAKDSLDRELSRFRGIQACCKKILAARAKEEIITIILEAIIEIFEFEMTLFLHYNREHRQMEVVCSFAAGNLPLYLPFSLDWLDFKESLILESRHPILAAWSELSLYQAIVCPYYNSNGDFDGLILGGRSFQNQDYFDPIKEEIKSSFAVMVNHATAMLLNYELTDKIQKQNIMLTKYSKELESMVAIRTEQLKLAEESRRRLLANISHDLRTPVSSVIGHVELLLEDIVESPQQQRLYLKRIHSKILGLNRLIQDLFELARLESWQTSFQMSEVFAKDVVNNTYMRYVSDVNNAGFRLEKKIDNILSNVRVLVDVERLDQVFANLISNAIRYIGCDGVIIISCELADSPNEVTDGKKVAVFKVADNGVGIPTEHVPNIFERFYRASPAREAPAEHSGLGLAIAKEIMEAHGGRIWVDEQVSCGCTICFALPII